MSQFKLLRGRLAFIDGPQLGVAEGKAQFDLIFQQLSKSYCASLPLDDVDGNTRTRTTHQERLPFAVVLSLEERAGESQIGNIEKKLAALFRRLIDVARNIPGPHQAGVILLEALDTLLHDHPDAPEAEAIRLLELDRHGPREWGLVKEMLDNSGGDMADLLDLEELTQELWSAFLARLGGNAGAAPALPAPGAPAVPVAAPALPVAQEFIVNQLMGWLTTDAAAGKEGSYGFHVEGITRFADNAVEYGTWARLDVFGPDGSQLLTRYVHRDLLAKWLYGDGEQELKVEIAPTRELRAALATPVGDPRKVTTVSGRLWFSDNRPFGQRTLALFVKPAVPALIDDCCPPAEFEFPGTCGEDLRHIPILQTPQALAVTQTDQAGYFEFSYTSDQPFASRYALLNVSGLAMPLALELVADKSLAAPAYIFPKPILLQVESELIVPEPGSGKKINWLDSKVEECGCRGIDFNQPNRALDEFKLDVVVRTTDPMIVRASIGQPGAAAAPAGAGFGAGHPSQSGVNRFFRTQVSREQQVDWDDSPVLAQAVTISHGRILTIRQVWRADGYSLGDLRYSLPLAPLQKKNIAVIDWDRSDTMQMESSTDYREAMFNTVGRERDISEIVHSALTESITGSSESRGGSSSAGGGLSFGMTAFFGASGGSSSAWSSSAQNSTRTLAANFMNQLRDKTVQSANAMRSQRVTTVQQVNQSESTRVVTETVANRNACHAITVQYFEVLRHFRVDHELAAVRECLYIPLPIHAFTLDKVLRWRDALARYLPAGLREHLDACERLQADAYGAAPTYADDEVTGISGTLDLALDFPMPPMKLEEATAWHDFFGIKFDAPSPLPSMLGELKRLAPEGRYDYFEKKIAPEIAGKLVASLRFTGLGSGNLEYKLGISAVLDSSYRAGGRHRILLVENGEIASQHIKRRDLIGVRVVAKSAVPDYASAILMGGDFTLATLHMQSRTVAAPVEGDALGATGKAVLKLDLRPHEMQGRKQADEIARTRLLEHLNSNVEYYHKAIWWTMDADRRFALLDGYLAPNSGGRSVASVVENRLAAIVGNCLVMPVAPGIRLDYFDEDAALGRKRVPATDDDDAALERKRVPATDDEDWLLARYRPLIPNPSTQIAVPTRGVFAESVMGSCNGCEKIDDSRNWQHWLHPLPDEPTAIEPVSMGSRARDMAPAEAAPLPAATIINQVASAIPPAPDPVGLAAAIAAVSNGAAFRDATGLGGTQANARDALSQSYASTTRFGEIAGEISKKKIDAAIEAMKMIATLYTGMPMPASSGGGSDSSPSAVKNSIKADAEAGRISAPQAQELIGQINQKMVEGLGSKEQSLPDVPEVREAIRRGREEGAPVSVRSGDARVDIGAPTRPAPAQDRPASGSRWPFGRKPKAGAGAAGGGAAAQALPTLKIEIVTTIRDVGGAWQVGEKSRQVIVLNCAARAVSLPEPTIGYTDLGKMIGVDWQRLKLKGVNNAFKARLDYAEDDLFELTAKGQTASPVRLLPDIDYDLRLLINLDTRRIRIVGSHDGFPSYSVLVDGKTVYDYEQSDFSEAYPKLMGTSDIEVDQTSPF